MSTGASASPDEGAAGPAVRLTKVRTDLFRSSGGCTGEGAGLLAGTCLLTGLILGVFLGLISLYGSVAILFSLLIGAGIGGVGYLSVRQGKVRSVWVSLVSSIAGGTVAVLTMHYIAYYSFCKQREEAWQGNLAAVQQLAAHFEEAQANPTPQTKELIDDLAKNPRELQALRVDSFWKYIDLMATDGVELVSTKKAGRKVYPVNLGYVGSYIYWFIDGGILVLIATAMMYMAASHPFCDICENWKVWHQLGSFNQLEPVRAALESGELDLLPTMGPLPVVSIANLSVCLCPVCGPASPVELKLERRLLGENGAKNDQKLIMVTAPGSTVPALEKMFAEAGAAAGLKPAPDDDDDFGLGSIQASQG